MSEQTENLERVKSNIGMTIFKFCSDRYRAQNYDFTANELTSYVRREHPEIVNDSTSRILRKLRNDGIVNYGVVGARKQGKYTLIGVQGEV